MFKSINLGWEKYMKGIILAGGTGSRLYPLTISTSKQLLPIYDKPMIYYPLSVLMLAGIKDILIISKREDLDRFQELFGNGQQLGLKMSYAIQDEPRGIAEAFLIAEDFIGEDNVAIILGDNIFYGSGFVPLLEKVKRREKGATIFGYRVKNPSQFGVVEFDENQKVISIEEKPINPKSNYAVTGLYFYDNKVVDYAKKLSPSTRNELEITDINKLYLENDELYIELLGRGFAWLDAGTHESLLEASQFIETIERRQGLKVACIEEIAYLKGYISKEQLTDLALDLIQNTYGKYLLEIVNSKS